MKLKKFLLNAFIATSLAFTQVANADAIFRNANDIPAPANKAGSNYITLPKNVAAQPNNVPQSFQKTQTQLATLPSNSLTNAGMFAQAPISLEAATLKQQTVIIDNDDTHVVAVSASSMNRVNTPFRNPIVLTNGGANYSVVGQDVYIASQSDQPIGVFIREDDRLANNSPVASLTLVPKPLAPQNITLVLASALKERLTNPNAKIATDYTDVLRQTMTAIAQHKLPDGYSKSNVNSKAIARIGGVIMQPKAMYSGVENNVYVYNARNATNQFIELNEPSFWHKGVRAVAVNGDIKLAPAAVTEIIIIADLGDGEDSIYD